MLNFLWIFMILAGIVYAAFTGNLPAVTDAALDAAQQAVTLCITMAGVLAFWVGLMRIAENAGMMQRAADRIYPLLHFLFPRIPREHAACKSIAANCIANFFGLGWAATPAGLQAMEDLDELEKERTLLQAVHQPYRKKFDFTSDRIRHTHVKREKVASTEMCIISGAEYFVASADSGDRDCLSQQVRLTGSDGYCGSSHCGYGIFYAGGNYLCKDHVSSRPETGILNADKKIKRCG